MVKAELGRIRWALGPRNVGAAVARSSPTVPRAPDPRRRRGGLFPPGSSPRPAPRIGGSPRALTPAPRDEGGELGGDVTFPRGELTPTQPHPDQHVRRELTAAPYSQSSAQVRRFHARGHRPDANYRVSPRFLARLRAADSALPALGGEIAGPAGMARSD